MAATAAAHVHAPATAAHVATATAAMPASLREAGAVGCNQERQRGCASQKS